MIKILVTGSNGQLGSEIRERESLNPDLHFTFVDIDELDLTDFKAVEKYFASKPFDFCINCAAYTNVDKAEDETDLAMLVNHTAVENLAKVCTKNDVFLIHISTDYIFDGTNFRPYTETDPPSPDSVYGSSKLKSEEAVIAFAEKWTIIRTSWLYSFYGHNFVKTILRYGQERNELKVVFDQVGTPTNAGDLATCILKIIKNTSEKKNKQIYHFSNHGVCSWFDFAKAIIELSGISCEVIPIESKDFPAKVNRPFYSVLNKAKISADFGIEIPHWRDSLKKVIKKIVDKK